MTTYDELSAQIQQATASARRLRESHDILLTQLKEALGIIEDLQDRLRDFCGVERAGGDLSSIRAAIQHGDRT